MTTLEFIDINFPLSVLENKEDLEEKRLTIDCRPNDEMGATEVYCNNFWIPAFSASNVTY